MDHSFYLDEYPTTSELREKLAEVEETLRNSDGRIDYAGPSYHQTTYEFTTGRYKLTLSLEQPT